MKTPKHQGIWIYLIITSMLSLTSLSAQHSCKPGYFLCSSQSIVFSELPPSYKSDELPQSCQGDWVPNELVLYWQMSQASSIEFTLNPINNLDDLDFVLYEINPAQTKCTEWNPIRCSLSGPVLPLKDNDINCLGPTGLKRTSTITEGSKGCTINNSTFLKSVNAPKHMIYALVITNYTSNKGFELEFESLPQFSTAEVFPYNTFPLKEGDFTITRNDCILKLEHLATEENPPLHSPTIAISPNPTSNHITIISSSILHSYKLYDPIGRIIDYKKFSGFEEYQISLQNRSPGIYTIEIIDESGRSHISRISKI